MCGGIIVGSVLLGGAVYGVVRLRRRCKRKRAAKKLRKEQERVATLKQDLVSLGLLSSCQCHVKKDAWPEKTAQAGLPEYQEQSSQGDKMESFPPQYPGTPTLQ